MAMKRRNISRNISRLDGRIFLSGFSPRSNLETMTEALNSETQNLFAGISVMCLYASDITMLPILAIYSLYTLIKSAIRAALYSIVAPCFFIR